MSNIRISSYVQSKSNNYGLNSILVEIGNLDLYFSYQTVVAFRSPETGLVVSENNWGPTTGKHLNAIGVSPKLRIDRGEFDKQLDAMLAKYGLVEPRVG